MMAPFQRIRNIFLPSARTYLNENKKLPRGLMLQDREGHNYIVPEDQRKFAKEFNLFDVVNCEDKKVYMRELSGYVVIKRLPEKITIDALLPRR